MDQNIREINEKVQKESLFVKELMSEIGKNIVGQKMLVERLLIGILADGHILLEGVPEAEQKALLEGLEKAYAASVELSDRDQALLKTLGPHRWDCLQEQIPRQADQVVELEALVRLADSLGSAGILST